MAFGRAPRNLTFLGEAGETNESSFRIQKKLAVTAHKKSLGEKVARKTSATARAESGEEKKPTSIEMTKPPLTSAHPIPISAPARAADSAPSTQSKRFLEYASIPRGQKVIIGDKTYDLNTDRKALLILEKKHPETVKKAIRHLLLDNVVRNRGIRIRHDIADIEPPTPAMPVPPTPGRRVL